MFAGSLRFFVYASKVPQAPAKTRRGHALQYAFERYFVPVACGTLVQVSRIKPEAVEYGGCYFLISARCLFSSR